jgi:hypothetical protein
VTVRVSATDDRGVARVELAIDDGTWTDLTPSREGTSYSYTWETDREPDGAHRLRARATDTAGQVAEESRLVTVDNQEKQPRLHEKVSAGRVLPGARDSWQEVTVHSRGWVGLTLSWSTAADLDFYVYAPDGAYIGRAYTLRNPETFQIDTERWGEGTYRIRVNLYSGGTTDFSLSARGFQVDTFSGTVTPESREFVQDRWIGYQGRGRVRLSWPGSADLDFYVYDPAGVLRARAYTLQNPEVANFDFDRTGYWRVRVNLYRGTATEFTLKIYAPEANLS